MPSKFKVIAINILVFFILLAIVEFGFRGLENIYKFSQGKRRTNLNFHTTMDKSQWFKIYPRDLIKPVPEKYLYHPSSELLKSQVEDAVKKYTSEPGLSLEKPDVTHVKAVAEGTDLTVFEVKYMKDPQGRRYVENQEWKKKANKFVLAFGCSFTFGEGLDQGMDYPSQLAAKLDNSWKVYNFGVMGYGANDVLKNIDQKEDRYLKGVQEEEGVFVWLLLKDHLMRTFCPWNCYLNSYRWIQSKPEFEILDGKFVTKSSFKGSPKWKRKIFKALARVHFVQRYGFPESPSWTEEDFEMFAKMLEEITLRMKEKKIRKKYVIFEHDLNDPIFREILIEYGFEPIEFFNAITLFPPKHLRIPVDGHPTSEHNWLLSEVLYWHISEDWRKLSQQ